MTDTRVPGRLLPFPRSSLQPAKAQPTITISLEHLLHLFDAFVACATALDAELANTAELTEEVSQIPGRNELGLRRSIVSIRQEKEKVLQMLRDLKAMRAGGGGWRRREFVGTR